MSNNQPHQHPTPNELHQLFEVNFEDGVLYWKKRDRKFFSSDRSANVWNAKHAGKQAFTANHKSGYKHGLIFSKCYLSHRVIYAMRFGEWPTFIDHINGNRADNRICNLRSVTRTENSRNAKKPTCNTSGHIGVSWNARDKRWCAYITLNKKRKALGNFVAIEDAIQRRKESEFTYGFHSNHGR